MSRLSIDDLSIVTETGQALEDAGFGGGPGGASAWGDITGTLSDQTDLQTALDAKTTEGYVDAAVAAHAGAVDPHPDYLKVAEADSLYDPLGEAASEVTAHEGLSDPHPQYLTAAEGNAAYQPLDSDLTTIAANITAAGLAILDDADASAQRTTLGVAIGTNVQAFDATLSALAGLDTTTGLVEQTGTDTFAKRAIGVGAASSIPTRDDADTRYAASSHGIHITDGDKGDVTVGSSGTTLTLDKGYALSTVSGAVAVGLTSTSAYVTAPTTISAATYADITGASVSLAAGTWLVIGHVTIGLANAIIQAFVALTHSDNTVITEVAASRPASGTANLISPFTATVVGIVSPASTTTYKLRGARGLTTHTGSWTAMDGNGVNTTNHATNNSDKSTSIFAIRIA